MTSSSNLRNTNILFLLIILTLLLTTSLSLLPFATYLSFCLKIILALFVFSYFVLSVSIKFTKYEYIFLIALILIPICFYIHSSSLKTLWQFSSPLIAFSSLLVLPKPFFYRLLSILTKALIFILVFSTIAVLSKVFFDLGPFYLFPNFDGRPNGIFIGSLSNSYSSNFLRPSGLFDEPGTLANIISLHLLSLSVLFNTSFSYYVLLLSAYITQSFSYIMFSIPIVTRYIFATFDFKKIISFRMSFKSLLPFIYLSLGAIILTFLFKDYLLIRVAKLSVPSFGDNQSRLGLFFNAYSLLKTLDLTQLIFGIDKICYFSLNLGCNSLYGYFQSNLLGSFVAYGFLGMLPYIFIILYLLFTRRVLISLAFIILLASRQDFYLWPFTFYYCIFARALFLSKK